MVGWRERLKGRERGEKKGRGGEGEGREGEGEGVVEGEVPGEKGHCISGTYRLKFMVVPYLRHEPVFNIEVPLMPLPLKSFAGGWSHDILRRCTV